MEKKNITLLVVLGAVILFIISQVSLYQNLVNDEENIKVSDKKMYTCVDKMVKQIESQGLVAENYKETLIEVLKTYTGPDGRKAGTFINAVAEAIPGVPQQIWNNIAATMNAVYAEFKVAQDNKLERIAEFRKKLRSPLYLIIKPIGGFPTINLDELEKLVLGQTARNAQETKQLETVNPFNKNK